MGQLSKPEVTLIKCNTSPAMTVIVILPTLVQSLLPVWGPVWASPDLYNVPCIHLFIMEMCMWLGRELKSSHIMHKHTEITLLAQQTISHQWWFQNPNSYTRWNNATIACEMCRWMFYLGQWQHLFTVPPLQYIHHADSLNSRLMISRCLLCSHIYGCVCVCVCMCVCACVT